MIIDYSDLLSCVHSKIINTCFETNTHLTTVGEAVITPLQKPGKAKGPLTSIHPSLSPTLSERFFHSSPCVGFSSRSTTTQAPRQAAYKRGRSCGDLVWCQRMLLAVVMERHWSFHKMGIDMSAAFYTSQQVLCSTFSKMLAAQRMISG